MTILFLKVKQLKTFWLAVLAKTVFYILKMQKDSLIRLLSDINQKLLKYKNAYNNPN